MSYERKSPPVIKRDQNLVADMLEVDIDFDPKHIDRFFVSNIFTRTLSHLVGWTGKQARRLSCTAAGILKVAPTGSGFETNDTHSGTAADAYGAVIAFDSIASRVDVHIQTHPAVVKRSSDGVVWDDEFTIPADTWFSFDASTHSVNIKNAGAGNNAVYQFIGWF